MKQAELIFIEKIVTNLTSLLSRRFFLEELRKYVIPNFIFMQVASPNAQLL